MSRRWKLIGALIVFSCAAGFSSAGWWDVQVADVQLDLFRARQEALDTLETGSSEADALAVAGWWYENLDNLFDPGEILQVGSGKGGAELNFHLGRIAAELQATPPPGALNEVELSGPWGVFGRLDLERDELPGIRTFLLWARPGVVLGANTTIESRPKTVGSGCRLHCRWVG